jgi:hypothetical protein
MNPIDTQPPPHATYPGVSVDLVLVYADGREVPGYLCSWSGWMRSDGWVPCECDGDDVMPVGWRLA